MAEEKSERSTWQIVLAMVLLGPPLIVFSLMGFNFLDAAPFNPYQFAFNEDYRQQVRARWQQHPNAMWRELGSLLAILIMVVVTLCLYFAIYSAIRYHALPAWMERIYCFLASCHAQ